MNTRQNGYNISADVYGYNESYYLPAIEAVSRIELVRGAAALQYGAQFGGLVNYVVRDCAATKPIELMIAPTVGSDGLFNSFQSVGGHLKKFDYYAFIQYRYSGGYRPNSQQRQLSGFGKVQYSPNSTLNISAEYSLIRNRIKMPGGLTDSLFNKDPKTSSRSRNWLRSPWNIVAGILNYRPSDHTTLSIKATYLFSSRSLVWRNEDGGPQAVDSIDPATSTFVPREVGIEKMHSITTEMRMSHEYALGHYRSTLAGGFRLSHAWFKRLGGGKGSTGSDFDLSITGDWGYNLDFTSTNIAPFAENMFRLSDRFSVTPGFRFEYLYSTSSGYKTADEVKLFADQRRNRYFTLAGIGMQYETGINKNVYANVSQAYRPIDYGQLEPFGVSAVIDQNMKDARGFNSDLGYRGFIKSFFNFDFSAFYLWYHNRIGETRKQDGNGNNYALRTNTGNSAHKGIESYVEFNLLKYFKPSSKYSLSIFNSFAYIDARYASGEFRGNRVETANKTIERMGLNATGKIWTATFQYSRTGDAYGDAGNSIDSENPIAGYIPAYTVMDLSATLKLHQFSIRAGLNNIADTHYFTRRTDEYPGPGIIPSNGRSFYIGFSAAL